ncbi:hypothetical protein F7Q99_30880 [Streptomyces kaniharaensis]|uniref:Uncharacterized protein n=1 Tax=Streptomyces kaniharaensis TaxID=212423 RepID=A0A6N7KXW6_9ACTN|nr:hypothetical protein [Streptomyces kaniharaensis]MQS16482.1 hypothetical protein [Streptomyces kaniharaensis]
MSEVCRTCAEQIPRAKVVGGAPARRTPSGRADHIGASNQATHRTTAAAFLPPQPTTCPQAPSGGTDTEPNQPKAAGQSRLLTFPQGQAARQLLAYIATLPLTSFDARLLAVIVAIRAAREGRANFIGQDLRALRLEDPAQALADLGTLGWLPDGDLLNGDPSQAISVTAPGLGPEGPLHFGKQTRTRVSGWTSRVVAAKPLKKARPDLRLAALYLAAHANPGGRGTVAGLPQECEAAAPGLRDAGYLDALEHPDYQIAEGLLHLVPSPDLTPAPRLDRPERFRVADGQPKTPATHVGTPRGSSRMLARE